jgi:hypothetical protein
MMPLRLVRLGLALVLAVVSSGLPAAAPPSAPAAVTGASLESIGPLAFGPEGVLFAADPQGAAIYALNLSSLPKAKAAGTKAVPNVDQKIAALLGTDAASITVTDLAVDPKSQETYVAIMRGQGASAAPALVRIDGDGELSSIPFDKVSYTRAALPNAPVANPGDRRNPRPQSVTDMAFVDGRLIVTGLSNEEFASKLRSVAYPFSAVPAGTSVEIYHGNHGQLETRSPIFAFVPYKIGSTPHLIAGYLCTPLVKFPMSAIDSTQKVVGTTIAELGNRNRPIDMVVYNKGGQDYLLMSNTSRGVMKIPTADFGSAPGITSRVDTEKAGIAYETIADLAGVEQLDLLGKNTIVLIKSSATGKSLETVPVP